MAAHAHAALEGMDAHAGAEPRGSKDMLPVTETDREAAVVALQRAAGDGRLPLQEFSERVGTALTAETRDQLVPHQATFARLTIRRRRGSAVWRFRQAM